MAVKILIRRATAAEWTSADPTLAQGELGYETDTQKLKMGDGSTAWTSLAYTGADNPIPASAFTARGQIITGSASTDYAVLSLGSAGQIVIEDPVAGTLTYQTANLNAFPDVDTSGVSTNDLLARGASTWGGQSFSASLTASEETVRQVIANADMTKRTVVGVAGYIGASFSSAVFKYFFPSDSVSSTTSSSDFMYNNAGFSNPAVAGYMAVGNETTTVYKWTLPADTVSTTTSAPNVTEQNGGFSNPSVAGYLNRRDSSNVYKWTFPADTVSTTTSSPIAMLGNAGFANPTVAGYLSLGFATTVYKWAFPADTVSTTTSPPSSLFQHAGFSNPYVAGYFSRSQGYPFVYKWAFPTDTVSTITAVNSTQNSSGFSNPTVAGYFARGSDTNGMEKISFPSDTTSVTTNSGGYIYRQVGTFANA